MTELEKMQRAKMYIDKLSQGINPVTDEMVKDDDALNNIRISRCLFYVSDILRQVIDNGGQVTAVKKSSSKKEDFHITGDELTYFQFSPTPLLISEIVERLNRVAVRENMKKLTTMVLTQWLVYSGFLEEVITAEGKATKMPTEAGFELGLITQFRTGKYGQYEVVLYDIQLQHFIIDNIYAALEHYKSMTELRNTAWDEEQDAYLKKLYMNDCPVSDMAKVMKRTPQEIRNRIKKLFPGE